jgi:chemotaxis protein methyltransferase CheR
LGKRIRGGHFKSFRDYYQFVIQDSSGQELTHLLDSISTNFTFFFREQKHFDYLVSELVPRWLTRSPKGSHKIRIWSAGCSSGEEPYSIAISLMEALGNLSDRDVTILATDISTKVLRIAEQGIYHHDRVQSLSPSLLKKYFLRGDREWRDHVKVKNEVRRLIHFKRLNLMEPFSFTEPFDCIFCRNVMIYFDKKVQADLISRFDRCLNAGGALFIGHSESLTGIRHPFRYVRPAIYEKGRG